MKQPTPSPDGTPTRAAIYVRVSTDEQATEGYSLAEQERRGRQVAEREGWQPSVYPEPARSGADRDRPELARLLRDVEAGMLDVVWFDTQDRLARDVGHTADLVAAFIAADVAVWEGSHPIDLSDDGQAQVDLKALFAAWERRKIKARTRKGIAGRAREGKPWGRSAAYGYRRGDNGHWTPHPDERPIYLRIYREFIDGGTYSGIAKRLHRDGVPTREGGAWGAPLLKKILTRRYGLGEFIQGGQSYRGSHEPLIDEDTWQAAQARAALGSKYAPSRGGRRPHLHLFTNGILRCSCCGEAMLPRSDGDRYACRSNVQLGGAGTCEMPAFKRERIDRAGLGLFERHFLDLATTREHVAADLDSRLAEIDAQRRRADREAAEKTAQRARVERDYLAGDLGAGSYERFVHRLDDERAAADAERDRLAAHADALRASRAELDAEADVLRRLGELRVAVLERKRSAEQAGDVDALRAALAQVGTFYLDIDGTIAAGLRVDRADPFATEDVAIPLPRRDTTQHLTLVS